MSISDEQRKVVTAIEDSIWAIVYTLSGIIKITYSLVAKPRSIERLIENDVVPPPLTYLAACTLVFAISSRLIPSYFSMAFHRLIDSISLSMPIPELSIAKCLAIVAPTVLIVSALSYAVGLMASYQKRGSAVLATCVLGGFELLLISSALVIGLIGFGLFENHWIIGITLGYFSFAVLVFSIIWPLICLARLSRQLIEGRSSMIRRFLFLLIAGVSLLIVPMIGAGINSLQGGYYSAPFSPPNTCIFSGAEHYSFDSGRQQLNFSLVLMNRGSSPFFVEPPDDTRIVNGKMMYIAFTDEPRYDGSGVAYWDWPAGRVIPVDPDKSIILNGFEYVAQAVNEKPNTPRRLQTQINVLLPSGAKRSIWCSNKIGNE